MQTCHPSNIPPVHSPVKEISGLKKLLPWYESTYKHNNQATSQQHILWRKEMAGLEEHIEFLLTYLFA